MSGTRAAEGPRIPAEGLFGPESVTWRVHADPAMLLGGLRALLLQALHPLAMAGVSQHSAFREDPWGRLDRTAAFIGAVTYGTGEEAREAVDRVRRVHRHVR
ncbi:oxygenase MpaB family protein, partial [Kitasatospora sp. NPDC007106]|uniref:oxygenase MpaB family protein n=1 Tax=Kitasatospora sp. NPDC007106 TaxID=3156914 RepID=UPI0033D872B7